MKKFLSIIFAVLLLTSVTALAGCEYKPLKVHWKLTFDLIDYEENDYAPKYFDADYVYDVYRLSVGKQYYIRVYNYSYYTRGNEDVDREKEGQFIKFKNCFVYDGEEVEITNDMNNIYKGFPMKGLKRGSAIIQYDASDGEEPVLNENYLKILIIFE